MPGSWVRVSVSNLILVFIGITSLLRKCNAGLLAAITAGK